jgi:hypothetical protein
MNIYDLSVTQLKRAAVIKEGIEKLNKELRGILGASANSRAEPKKNQTMSASLKKKIAATQKARWAIFDEPIQPHVRPIPLSKPRRRQ